MHVPKLHWILVENSEQKTRGLRGGCAIHSSHRHCLFSITSEKAQLRAPLSSLQTAWTGFDPYLYIAVGHPQQARSCGNSNCKVFYTQQGHCVCHTPGARMVSSAFHSTKAVVSQVGALQTGLQACED